jgi:hypothetical protein
MSTVNRVNRAPVSSSKQRKFTNREGGLKQRSLTWPRSFDLSPPGTLAHHEG